MDLPIAKPEAPRAGPAPAAEPTPIPRPSPSKPGFVKVPTRAAFLDLNNLPEALKALLGRIGPDEAAPEPAAAEAPRAGPPVSRTQLIRRAFGPEAVGRPERTRTGARELRAMPDPSKTSVKRRP